jgi:hypothetical protein
MSADKNNFYGKNGQKLLKEEVRGAVFRKITLHIEKNSHGIVRRRGDPRKQKNAAVCFLGLLRLFFDFRGLSPGGCCHLGQFALSF